MPANIAARAASAAKMSFAHLSGISRSAKKADKDPDEDEHENGAGADNDQEDQNREDGDSKKGSRAEEDDKDDKDDQDDKKSKKARRAKGDQDDEGESEDDADAAAEDDDDEEEMRGKSAAAAARRRERARCAAILGSKAAARNVALAASLAFKTNMTRQQALAVLSDTPATTPAGGASPNRAARNPNLGAGGEASSNSKQVIASRWDAAMQKVRGK